MAGIVTVVPAGLPVSPMLERAAKLADEWYTGSRLWFGPTGEALSGTQVADHLAAGLSVLERDGWDPGVDGFGIEQALSSDWDLLRVAGRVLELVLCANSGALAASFELWEQKSGRTLAEVRGLMVAAVEFARTYGPAKAVA